jgi:small-conductance mechanosensitive channel
MNTISRIEQWIVAHPTSLVVFKYTLMVLVIILGIHYTRRFLKRRIPDSTVRYRSQKGIEVLGYVLIILLTITYFTGNVKDFTLALGLFSAGVAFTLQELILSIAGSLYIFAVKVYSPGDRVEINGIKGDIIDIDSIYTTLMEIGEWVSTDNYSGRIVKLSNAFVFKGPIYNYSQDFPFIWDEFNIMIRYGSDMDLAKSLMLEVARDILSEYSTNSKAEWKGVVKKYYIEDAQVDPTLAITLTDNWAQFNLRYIVHYQKRRYTKHLLNDAIRKKVEATDGSVLLASATMEVVRLPEVKVNMPKT